MATSEMLQATMQHSESDKHEGKPIKLEIKHDVSSIFGKKYKPKIIINNPAAAAAAAASAAANQNNNSSEQRPFVCMFCPAAFKNESNLVQHVRVHVNGNTPKLLVHSCVYCNRSFKQQTNLEIHMRTYHSFNEAAGSQQINYNTVNQAAINASYMSGLALWEYKNMEEQQQQNGGGGGSSSGGGETKTIKTEMSGGSSSDGEQQWKTSDGGGQSATATWEKTSHSQRDIQAYQVERPHKCVYCIKSFKQQAHLKQHMRIHSDEKPYECTYCERRFRQKAVLNQHVRLHTGEMPYVCVQCGKAFRQLTNLKSHLNTCTADNSGPVCVSGVQLWEQKNSTDNSDSTSATATGGAAAPRKRGRKSTPQNQYIKIDSNKIDPLLLKPESESETTKSLWAKAMSLETANKSLQQHWAVGGGSGNQKEMNSLSGVTLWEQQRAVQQISDS